MPCMYGIYIALVVALIYMTQVCYNSFIRHSSFSELEATCFDMIIPIRQRWQKWYGQYSYSHTKKSTKVEPRHIEAGTEITGTEMAAWYHFKSDRYHSSLEWASLARPYPPNLPSDHTTTSHQWSTLVQKPQRVAIKQSWWLPKHIRANPRMIYSMQSWSQSPG